MPSWVKDKCIYCGLCQAVCPAKVIEVKKQEKELTFNERIASIAANASRCALQVHGKAEAGLSCILADCSATE